MFYLVPGGMAVFFFLIGAVFVPPVFPLMLIVSTGLALISIGTAVLEYACRSIDRGQHHPTESHLNDT